MKQVNVHQAKSQLSQLIADAEAGEDVVIARAGKPVVRLELVANGADRKILRKPGAWKGKIRFAPDYDQADAEILADFEASIEAPLFPEKP